MVRASGSHAGSGCVRRLSPGFLRSLRVWLAVAAGAFWPGLAVAADEPAGEKARLGLTDLAVNEEHHLNPFRPNTPHHSIHREYWVAVLNLAGFQERFDRAQQQKEAAVDYAAAALAASDALVAEGLARVPDAKKVRFIELVTRMAAVADDKACAALFRQIGSTGAAPVLAKFGANDVADYYQLKSLALEVAVSDEPRGSELTDDQRRSVRGALRQSVSKRLSSEQLAWFTQVTDDPAAHDDASVCWAGRLNTAAVLQQRGQLRTWALRAWFKTR